MVTIYFGSLPHCIMSPMIEFGTNFHPSGILGEYMTAFLKESIDVEDRFFEPAHIRFPHLIEVKDNLYGITSKSSDPLAFLPPGDFQYFSVPFGDFNLSFARQSGRLWAYIHSGGPSLDKILLEERPENSTAALVPITEDGHGILFLGETEGHETPTLRVRVAGRLVKVDLGQRGIFVADMGSLRPKKPDPLIMPPHEKALIHLASFSQAQCIEIHSHKTTCQLGVLMDSFGPWMTQLPDLEALDLNDPSANFDWANIQYNGQCRLMINGKHAHASVLDDRITILLENGEAMFGRLPVA